MGSSVSRNSKVTIRHWNTRAIVYWPLIVLVHVSLEEFEWILTGRLFCVSWLVTSCYVVKSNTILVTTHQLAE